MASLGFISDLEMVASFGNALQTENFYRSGWASCLDGATVIVEQGAYFAEHCTADEEVAGLERAVLDKNRGHGAAAFVYTGFENCAGSGRIGLGCKFAEIR